MRLLAIDIGNSNVVWGVFDDERLIADWRVGTDAAKTADEYGILLLDLLGVKGLVPESLDAVILSSVVPPLTATFEELAEKYLHRVPLTVSFELKTGLTLQYENPAEIGTDRIVNAAAAFRQYGGPVIIVDFAARRQSLFFDPPSPHLYISDHTLALAVWGPGGRTSHGTPQRPSEPSEVAK